VNSARKVLAVLAVAASTVALTGCPDDVGSAESMGSGNRKVTPAYYGIWYAKSASPGCTYSMKNINGTLIWRQKYSRKNQTPSIILGTGSKNQTFSSTGQCGYWTRK
jgi:hypothetical protein